MNDSETHSFSNIATQNLQSRSLRDKELQHGAGLNCQDCSRVHVLLSQHDDAYLRFVTKRRRNVDKAAASKQQSNVTVCDDGVVGVQSWDQKCQKVKASAQEDREICE